MLALLTLVFIPMLCYIYFSGKFDNNMLVKGLYAFMGCSLAYVLFVQIKKLIDNKPILIFSNESLEIADGKIMRSFSWEQIFDWKIENDNGTHYLIIDTDAKKKRFNISWLERSAAEIEKLLFEYMHPVRWKVAE